MEPAHNQQNTNHNPSSNELPRSRADEVSLRASSSVNKALTRPRILVIAGVAVLIIALVVISPQFLPQRLNLPSNQSTDGVFTSFSATATGTVTKISGSEIEIENGNVRKTFPLAKEVLMVKNNLLEKIAEVLVPTAYAQTIPLKPSLPTDTLDKTSTGGAIPLAPRRDIKDVKVGDIVSLNLTKERETADWVVTSITLISK